MGQEPEYGRRRFLKESLFSVAKAAHEYVSHRDAPTEKKVEPTVRHDWLRPPGAVDEALFLERCTRCGDCVKACPYACIRLGDQDATPQIFPAEAPCYLCEDFPCIASCATDALLPLAGREDVRMGLAEVSQRTCTAGQGCNACVSQCPMHALTMDFDAFRVLVLDENCVGCGICEHTCKAVNDRISIKVKPVRLMRP